MTKAIVTANSNVNVREAPNTTAEIVGQLHKGDFVYGNINNKWIGFQCIYRANGTREILAGYAHAGYLVTTDEVEPEIREIAHVIVIYKNGDVEIDQRRVVDAVKDAMG